MSGRIFVRRENSVSGKKETIEMIGLKVEPQCLLCTLVYTKNKQNTTKLYLLNWVAFALKTSQISFLPYSPPYAFWGYAPSFFLNFGAPFSAPAR